MELYLKFTYPRDRTHSLDAIGEYELQERKVAYEGTLDSNHTTMTLKRLFLITGKTLTCLYVLDKKLQFIDLANVLSRANTVPLVNALGAVAQTDMAIVNEAHSRGYIVPTKGKERSLTAQVLMLLRLLKASHKWIGPLT